MLIIQGLFIRAVARQNHFSEPVAQICATRTAEQALDIFIMYMYI